jgi:RNA polymerase sigma-70 factor (ECF subfamily)
MEPPDLQAGHLGQEPTTGRRRPGARLRPVGAVPGIGSSAGQEGRARVNDPDPRTLARAREGDLGAFEDLVRQYQGDLWRFAYHFTRDRTLADDATQETFLRAFRFLGGFRGDSRFTSWLFRIARNCAMDQLRVRKTDLQRESRAPLVATSDAQARVELHAALDALTPEHREPFLLVEVFGLSYQEAADVLGVRVGTIKSRMHRARRVMMEALAVEEDAR